MVQLGSILRVTDKTCVVLVQCIKVLGISTKKIAFLGDVILVSVQWVNSKKFLLLKARMQKRYLKGTIHRGLVIRSRMNFQRIPGIFLKFDENAVVLITKNVVPVTNRVYGPVLREMCMRWPSLGCVTSCMI
jgi:large subunit ribosomal protein L14